MKRMKVIIVTCFLLILLINFFMLGVAFAQEVAKGSVTQPQMGDVARGNAFLAISISVGLACLAAGYAVGKVGAAAIGAATEKPEIFGRAIIFVGLAEGIAIYGLIIGIMLLGKV